MLVITRGYLCHSRSTASEPLRDATHPRQVIRSNNFAISPVLITLPTLDGFDVRFQATVRRLESMFSLKVNRRVSEFSEKCIQFFFWKSC